MAAITDGSPDEQLLLRKMLARAQTDMVKELRSMRHRGAADQPEVKQHLEDFLQAKRRLAPAGADEADDDSGSCCTLLSSCELVAAASEDGDGDEAVRAVSIHLSDLDDDGSSVAEEDEDEDDEEEEDDDDDEDMPIATLDLVDIVLRRQSSARAEEVTSIEQRGRVADVLSSQFRQNLEEMARASRQGLAPRSAADARRPANVAEELSQLNTNTRVSRLLSGLFRANLERALGQGAPSRVRQSSAPAPAAPQHDESGDDGDEEVAATEAGAAAQPLPPAVQQPRRHAQPRQPGAVVVAWDALASVSRTQQSAAAPAAPGALPVRRRERLVGAHAAAEDWQQTVAQDLRELESTGIVHDILSGEFRPVLELHFRQRAEQVGVSREQARAAMQGVARRSRAPRAAAAPEAAAPVATATTAASSESGGLAPSSRGMLRLQERMDAMASQLADIARFVRLGFDLQLDVQRSIRQEVAAAMHMHHGAAHPPAQHVAPAPASAPLAPGGCLICLDAQSDTLLYRCGHICTCFMCALDLKSRAQHCPICRAPIDDVIRAYIQTT